MTYQPQEDRDALANDRQVNRRARGQHPGCCRCWACVGNRDAYLAETAVWREAYENGWPPPVRGRKPGPKTRI